MPFSRIGTCEGGGCILKACIFMAEGGLAVRDENWVTSSRNLFPLLNTDSLVWPGAACTPGLLPLIFNI